MNPIECAKIGNTIFFEEAGIDVIQTTGAENGDSVLAVAAFYGQLNCCKMIYSRCPELLHRANHNASTALHQAAWNGFDDIVEFLITTAARKEDASDIVHQKLLMMKNFRMQTALHSAVRKKHLQCAKLLLEADPSNMLLRTVDNANDTAMHIAVRNHNLEIVNLLLDTDPGFVYAPNKSWQLTPQLLALQESSSGDLTSVAIRNLLIEKQPHECKKQVGEKGWTLLHHATLAGDITSIEHILEFCPDCVDVVDDQGQNFVHLAAKLEHEKVTRHILASTKISDNVINQQDIYGNTPLHIATSKGNANVGLSLLYDSRVDKFIVNKQGKTALAAIKFDYDKRRAGVYGLTDRVDEKELKDRSDFDLLVGALISTVSFTAGITVPGGFFNDGPNQGTAILHKKLSFQAFVLSNTMALALSLYAVFCHFCTRRLRSEESIIYQLKIATHCSLGAIFAMLVAFITGSYAVLSISGWLSISVCVICCCFFGFASRAMWRMIKEERQRRPFLSSRSIFGFSI